jgi:hypothetical protein
MMVMVGVAAAAGGSVSGTSTYVGANTFDTVSLVLIGKAKQHNIPKEDLREKTTIFNGRVSHNLSKIKAPEGMEVTINKSNWHIMFDKAMGFKRSAFFETKARIIEYMCQTMHSKAL